MGWTSKVFGGTRGFKKHTSAIKKVAKKLPITKTVSGGGGFKKSSVVLKKVARKLPIAKAAKKLPSFSGGNFSSKISPMKAGGFMAKFTPIGRKTSGFSETRTLKRATKLGTVAKKKAKKKSGITKIK